MQNTPLSRRSLLLAPAGLLAVPTLARAAPPALRVGNQKGGLRSLLEASRAPAALPYAIEWSEFPAAAPLLEALSADALDVGNMGDLAFLSVFASGAPLRAYAATRADPRRRPSWCGALRGSAAWPTSAAGGWPGIAAAGGSSWCARR